MHKTGLIFFEFVFTEGGVRVYGCPFEISDLVSDGEWRLIFVCCDLYISMVEAPAQNLLPPLPPFQLA